MLLIVALCGCDSRVAEDAAKEFEDVKLNYKKLVREKLTYGIYLLPSKDKEEGIGQIGQILKDVLLNELLTTMSFEVEVKLKDENVIVDSALWIFGGKMEVSSVCKKNVWLTPESLTVTNRKSSGDKILSVVNKNGVLVYDRDGETKQIEYPEKTISFDSLFAIVPQMPKKKGVRYQFDCLFKISNGKTEKPQEGQRFALVYSGKEKFDVAGKKTTCYRYDLVGGKDLTQFYVDKKGLVQCVKNKDSLIKLLTKDEIVKLGVHRERRKKAAAENRLKMLEDIHGVISVGEIDDINRLLDKDASLVNKKDDKGQTPLHKAIKLKKMDAVKLLLERGADITAVDNNGTGVLSMVWGDADTARYLLERSPELLEKRNKWEQTPLLRATNDGREELVKLYIEKGADVNAVGIRNEGPLWSWNGYKLSIGEALLAAGADIDAKTKSGWTVLHKMANNERVEAFKLLVSKGADIEALTNRGQTVLHFANDAQIATLILEKAPQLINIKDEWGRTPLHEVAQKSKSDAAVKVLLSKGADINVANEHFGSILHVAAENGQLEVVKCLLANGGNISVVNKYGATIAHRAKKSEIMKYLLSQEPKLANTRDKGGNTPLHKIAAMRAVGSAKVLLESGADLKAVNNRGLSALHYAADYSGSAMCEFLISQGLDVNVKDNKGNTPLDAAIKDKKTKLVELLKKHGAVRGAGK